MGITVLGTRVGSGSLTAAVASASLILPYLLAAAVCSAIAWYATRIPRGMS